MLAPVIEDLDLFATEVAPRRARCPNLNAVWMIDHDRRRDAPDRQTRVVSERPEHNRKQTFLVYKVFVMFREHDSPRILAHLGGCHESEFHRLVDTVGEFGKTSTPHDSAIGCDDVDDPFAQVTAVRTGHLHFQDDGRAGVDLRSRRAA